MFFVCLYKLLCYDTAGALSFSLVEGTLIPGKKEYGLGGNFWVSILSLVSGASFCSLSKRILFAF